MSGEEESLIGYKNYFLSFLFLSIVSCSAAKENSNPKINELSLKQLSETTKDQEKNQEKLDRYMDNWFYGHGLGQSITNIGTVVIFPPYALYLLGNAGLTLAGYQPLYLSSMLPEESKVVVLTPYNSLTSIPGRITSTLAGKDFNEQ